MKLTRTGKKEYFYCDLAACALGALLLALLLFAARRGAAVWDEAFYYTVPQRLLSGDRLIADEWHFTQFAYLFNVLPYFVFTRVTGGTEGLILFTRVIFAVTDLIFFGLLYRRLRPYKFWGLAGAFLFCALAPESFMQINYLTVSTMTVTGACLLLTFPAETPRRLQLIAIGALGALGALAEPTLVFVWTVWGAAVILRAAAAKTNRLKRREPARWMRPDVFFCALAGAVLVFAVFMGYLLLSGAFEGLGESLPYLLNSTEHRPLEKYLPKLLRAVRLYGWVNLAGIAACDAAALALRLRKNAPNAALKGAVLLAAGLFTGAAFVYAATRDRYTFVVTGLLDHELPVILFSAVPLLLCRRADGKLTALWACGTLFSLCVDFTSQVAVASGGKLCQTAGLLAMGLLADELRARAEETPATAETPAEQPQTARPEADRKQKKSARRFLQTAAALCLFVIFLWDGAQMRIQCVNKPLETVMAPASAAPFAETLTCGPCKGLTTSAQIRDVYDATLQDLDKILADAGTQAPEKAVFVAGQHSYPYLYPGMRIASFSAWYLEEFDRIVAYWRLHPENRPDYIYVPLFEADFSVSPTARAQYDALRGLLTSCEAVNGKAGIIIKVTGEMSLS